ncbi:MAG: tetratricopeptide repeat protein [Elusimicrobiota bacterium]
MKKARIFFLIVCFFVSPLIFFTNLTRNPYITQIVLLNIALLAAGASFLAEAAWAGEIPWPKTPMNGPLLGLFAAAAASFIIGYFGHAAFYRPAIISQGAAAFLFLGTNVVLPFYLSATVFGQKGREDAAVDLRAWGAFTIIWGSLWFAFPALRGPQAGISDVWGQAWDGYGALIWIAGIAGAAWLCRKNRWTDYLHLALAVGFLASVYGVIQYFNLEFIWPFALNPYGGRSVSTFGNPNFLSSFNVVLIPIAIALYAQSRGGRRAAYAAAFLSLEAALLCSLTRSSWLGAGVAVGLLFLSPEIRGKIAKEPRPYGFLFGMAIMMMLLWPESSIATGYRPSAMGRIIEFGRALKTHSVYSPLYQRLLIWSSAWLMGKENPLTGQGWGLFELFYPFYQGPILLAFDFLRGLRTHANNAHNEILEYWSQMGILGVGVLFWMWTAFFTASKRHFRSRRSEDFVFAAGAAGVAGMLTDNLLNVSLHFAVPAFLFWWIAGLVMASAGLPHSGDRQRILQVNSRPKKIIAVVLASLVLSLNWYWIRTWNRETHYFAGFKLNRFNQTAAAIDQLEIARSWGPREVNALYELGNALAREQRYADAVRAYRQALRANAGYDEIYFNIGAIESSHLGLEKDALRFMRASLFVNPISETAYNTLSSLYLRNPSEYGSAALSLLRRAVLVYPNVPDYWNNLGYLYTLGKKYPEAASAYSRALAINPDLTVARHNLIALIDQARLPKPAILSGLENFDELERLAARRNDSDAALALARKTAESFPQAAAPKFILGTILLARGRRQEAVPLLEWVVQRNPRNERACINLASAYEASGLLGPALSMWQRVLSLNPANAIARQRITAIQGISR